MRRRRISGFTAAVLVVTALIVAPLLLTRAHADSYTCRSGPLADVIHPESELGAQFRREVAFDSGYACNRTARKQVAIAGGIIAIAAAMIAVRRRRTRRINA